LPASGGALAFGRNGNLGEPGVRDIETIDGELRLLFRAWRVARVLSDRMPSTAHIDELLDERAATNSPLDQAKGTAEPYGCS